MEISSNNAGIVKFADMLLQQDADKVITADEIREFVSSNEAALVKANISSDDAISELNSMFKSDSADEASGDESDNPFP